VKLVSGGGVDLSGADLFANTFDGILVRGGHAHGTAVRIHDNGGFGIRVESQGSVEFSRSEALVTTNKAGRYSVEQPAGCASTATPCRPPSALIIN